MHLSYYCHSCKKKNYISSKATNRFELQAEVGDEISNRCSYCGVLEKKHINCLFAEPSKTIGFIALGLAILLSLIVFILGFIATLTFTIPIYIYFNAYKKASDFNKVMISRK